MMFIFILAGAFAILVKGHQISMRSVNDCVGEMSADHYFLLDNEAIHAESLDRTMT